MSHACENSTCGTQTLVLDVAAETVKDALSASQEVVTCDSGSAGN